MITMRYALRESKIGMVFFSIWRDIFKRGVLKKYIYKKTVNM